MPTVVQSDTKRYALESLPREIIQKHVLGFLSTQKIGGLSKTSKSLRADCAQALKERKVLKLLTHVVRGEEEPAIKMIEANPSRLLLKSRAKDYSGRTIEGTAFQAALGAHDTIKVAYGITRRMFISH